MKETKEDEPQFIDAESDTGGWVKGITFQQIVFNHLAKISQISTKEMSGGYWNNKVVNVGSGTQVVRTYVEDRREAFNNSVRFLKTLLLPHFDNEMKDAVDTINKEYNEEADSFEKRQKESPKSLKNEWAETKLEFHYMTLNELSMLLKRLNYLAQEGIVIE